MNAASAGPIRRGPWLERQDEMLRFEKPLWQDRRLHADVDSSPTVRIVSAGGSENASWIESAQPGL